ncbi:MAG TPA: dockerin type I repeat-containing protein [Coleofasciculaceae cyanobacterium]
MSMNPPKPGDIDGDGRTDRSDLALLKQVLDESGHGSTLLNKLSPEDRARLDVNRDGVITEADVAKLCEILMGDDQASATALAERFKTLRGKCDS